MDDHIENPNYGTDEVPYICLAVTMVESEKAQGKYTYYLSYNTSGGPNMEDVARTEEPRSDPILMYLFIINILERISQNKINGSILVG